ncbi:MAG: putative toxin-antitoxin system toxin component, PIN family [Deltaproteobacteria bacterium]|nr:putative toxin-antitoxin system toxin component, PIN family [Deltaproteobacteria bacterium]
MKRLRVVVDTNVVVSALLFPGLTAGIRELWKSGAFTMLASGEMFAEYVRVLAYPKFALAENEVRALLDNEVVPFITPVKPGSKFPPTCRDPDDDKFLACAAAGRADFIVTGDDDLLVLKKHGRCRIVTVKDALALLGS